MTLKEMIAMLEETGFPVAYGHFPKEAPPTVPYIALTIPYTDNFFAENKVWKQIAYGDIELCTEHKDTEAEKKLTDVLNSHNITWQKTSEDFIEDDGVFSIFYEFEEVYDG